MTPVLAKWPELDKQSSFLLFGGGTIVVLGWGIICSHRTNASTQNYKPMTGFGGKISPKLRGVVHEKRVIC